MIKMNFSSFILLREREIPSTLYSSKSNPGATQTSSSNRVSLSMWFPLLIPWWYPAKLPSCCFAEGSEAFVVLQLLYKQLYKLLSDYIYVYIYVYLIFIFKIFLLLFYIFNCLNRWMDSNWVFFFFIVGIEEIRGFVSYNNGN